MIKELTFPVIHTNGSDEESLRRQYNKLFCAVSDAQAKLLDVDFHQRDYYPLGEAAWQNADSERIEVCEAINKVYRYARSHMHRLDYGKEPLPDEN
jgi:hypothetical protein